jgi:transcriptional regulator with XRE-family HTH domain
MPPRKNFDRMPANDPEREYLAQKLKEAREYLGLSQEYVSQQTGIPRPAISEIEAGRRKVESLELNRLAVLYGRPWEYFLPEHGAAASAGASELKQTDQAEIRLRSLTKDLPREDREEILRFAEYVRHKKSASRTPGSSIEGNEP